MTEITEKEIIDLLKKNPNGLTMAKISEILKIDYYNLKEPLALLKERKQIVVIDVGASKLVKLNLK